MSLISSRLSRGDEIIRIFSCLPTLSTERLILRCAKRRDAASIFQYARNPNVARYVLWEAHESIRDSRAYVRYLRSQYRRGEPASYVLVRKEDGRVFGTIGFMSFDRENLCAEVGYSLAEDCWGQGFATEALRAVLRLSFETMHLHRVEAQHDCCNPSSGRVMEKCGMHREGVLRKKIFNKGDYRDVVLWSVLEKEWRDAHNA